MTLTWQPFHLLARHDIPERILEQYNRAQVSTMMGLFAELKHAWITIDNALYLWDYTHPNPELVGFEEQPNSITAVKLLLPKPNVFTSQITHLLVVATTAEIILIGLSCLTGPAGNSAVTLYQTRMALSVRGTIVNSIEGAAGRIFFSVKGENDVYEMTYQQEEKWFQSRCGKINHTATGLSSLAPPLGSLSTAFSFVHRPQEHIVQMKADDSRNLLYTLSSMSAIRTFHVRPNGGLECTITLPRAQMLSNMSHALPSEAVDPKTSIVSISPIPATESQKLHLVAVTSAGWRIFLSATSASSWGSASSSAPPTSMQLQHVRLPPVEPSAPSARVATLAQIDDSKAAASSQTLQPTRMAERFSPGYFFCFTQDQRGRVDRLFVSATESGQTLHRNTVTSQGSKPPHPFHESYSWLALGSQAEDIGQVTLIYVAASTPLGFGNEPAIQFDKPVAEIAVLTNNGIYVLRRKRLVDVLAAGIQYSGSEAELNDLVRVFGKLYTKAELEASALAVACGHGQDIPPDARVVKAAGSEVPDLARKIFIDQGGAPSVPEDNAEATVDMVRPSPRHEGVALYMSRLVRSIWQAPIFTTYSTPSGGKTVVPIVSLQKLRQIQRDMTNLQEFLALNKSFIDGLAGPESLTRAQSKREEVFLQAEHRALHSLVTLTANIIEGISFVLVLFEEGADEIVFSLSREPQYRLRALTFEGLFVTVSGKELAKELVKAIVNRSIANGANVDTVAEALRRRCGSFCSADDVIIFKAQEHLKKASEAGHSSELGRRLLNESLKLFQQVSASLSREQLELAVDQFVSMDFYAGAIKLALTVANEADRGNRALAWINSGKRDDGVGQNAYIARTNIYKLVHKVILRVDEAQRQEPQVVDGMLTRAATRFHETRDVVDNSDDEVFQYDLYDWYLAQGRTDRILAVDSHYITIYLQKKAKQSVDHANLLWRYHAQRENFHEAASVQLQLAKSEFLLSLDKRIEYLSNAKTNASSVRHGVARQSRQLLLHEVQELLTVSNIQQDLLQRLKNDARLNPDRRTQVLDELDGQILGLTHMFNIYADPAGYFDICLLIFQAADHRRPADVTSTWQNLIDQTHQETVERGQPQPYEAVAEKTRSVGSRLHLSENVFPISDLLPMLERYAFEFQRNVGPAHWVIDVFLDLQVPYDVILSVLERMFYNDEAPFQGRNRKHIADDILYICRRWYEDTIRTVQQPFGGHETVAAVSQLLRLVTENGIDPDKREECATLRQRLEQFLR